MDAVPQKPTNPDRNLELLVIRCQLGDRSAFETLIGQWAEPLRRHLLRVTGRPDAADDLAQDIWLGVVRGIGGLRDARRFRAWLFGIAHRQVMGRFRDRYADRIDPDIDLDNLATGHDSDRAELHRVLAEHLARLPMLEREVLTLFYLEGLSLAETAAALDIPVGTVKSRLHRARAMLRAKLDNMEESA